MLEVLFYVAITAEAMTAALAAGNSTGSGCAFWPA